MGWKVTMGWVYNTSQKMSKKIITRSYGVFLDIPSPVRRLDPTWPMISFTYSFQAGGPNSQLSS